MMQDQFARDVIESREKGMAANIWLLYVFIFFILVAVAFLFIYYKWLRAPLKKSQRKKEVFNRFSTVNELNNHETSYLKQIANHYQLPNPYLIFVKRSLFDEASGKILASGVDLGVLKDKLYRPE